EKEIMEHNIVKEVYYHPDLIEKVNKNIKRVSFVILGFAGILLFIAIALINNTIRLSIYSKRFLIRSMQLVGATRWFIQRPFLFKGLLHGIYSALIASGLIGGIFYLAYKYFPDFIKIQDMKIAGIILVSVFLLGMFISLVATYFAVKKYLRIRPDRLF
ncbi:MAG: cell division protein FtsX, partial [Flavobacteriales bacterium]